MAVQAFVISQRVLYSAVEIKVTEERGGSSGECRVLAVSRMQNRSDRTNTVPPSIKSLDTCHPTAQDKTKKL